MQDIESLLPSACAALPLKASAEIAPPLASTAARTLWVRMAEIYGHRWTSAYGDDSSADGPAGTWAKGLAGITPAQVAAGLNACIASSDPWPPTLPEFRAKCLGIPSFAAVRMDADKASPFARLVWQHLDGYAYRQASSSNADRMLREAYELAREFVMLGGALPAPAAGEITEGKREAKPASRAEAESRMAEIMETLRTSETSDDEQELDRKTLAAGGGCDGN